MERFVYRKKILHLDGGRTLVTEFRNGGGRPFVDLFCHDTSLPEDLHLRIYSTEYDQLKRHIQSYIDYMQLVHDREHVGLGVMPPSVQLRADLSMRPEGGSFLVDCSRSHIWLLVRYRPNDLIGSRPKTVMAKEWYFPIQLAFKVVDFPKMGGLWKDIEVFFSQENVKRKQALLERRLTTPSEDRDDYQTPRGCKRRITLSPVPELFDDLETDAGIC